MTQWPPMYVESLSLFTAFSYGASAVLARKGMRGSNPITGAIVAALVQVVVLSSILVAWPPMRFSWLGVAFFVMSGLLASTLGRLLNYTSIERLGVPMSATIIGSSPLFSTAFAVAFIGEGVTLPTIVGTLLIVSGIGLTSERENDRGPRLSSMLAIPIASAAFYGASSVVRKVGLNLLPEAALGAFIGAVSSLVTFVAYLAATRRLSIVRMSGESGRYFLASGVVVSIGWLTMFNALEAGNVSVVSALIGSNPLFSFVLSALWLKDSEKLGWRAAAGCIAIVAGAVVIAL